LPANDRSVTSNERSRHERDDDGDGTRTVRLQELIREEVNLILRDDGRDPRLPDVRAHRRVSCARSWRRA
jgi:hypothetical protein